MTNAKALLAATLLVPIAMLLACLSKAVRDRMPALLAFAPLPALTTALMATNGTTLVLPRMFLGLTLTLDTPGAMLLGVAALLWIAAGAFASTYLRDKPNGGSFAVWWLMTLVGNLGVFIAADVVSFYLFFTLASLAAYGLVAYDGTSAARRAAAIYVALALVSEAFLLMGFVLLVAGSSDGSLRIHEAVAALSTSSLRDPTLAILVVGFALKLGLVPLHVWMPLTYRAAPIPAAAVLSGAAVKAGVIGLVRFLPFDTALPHWGEALAAIGLFSAFYGVAIGITQPNPKTVLAYSSVSQMGIIATVLGMGLAAGDESAAIAACFYATYHILAKGGLFLAVGLGAETKPCSLWLVLLPAAVVALGLAGLPLSGGAWAKAAIKAPLGEGVVGTLATLSAVGSTLLMLHFLRCLMREASANSWVTRPFGLALPWVAMAVASVVLPWVLYPLFAPTLFREALIPKVLWEGLLPVVAGSVLAIALRPLWRLLPHIPEGDVLIIGENVTPLVRGVGAAMERIDSYLCQWSIAAVSLLVVTVMLGAAIFGGG